MKKKVKLSQIPKCTKCGGLVKPDIVFFGEAVRILFFSYKCRRLSEVHDQLPDEFVASIPKLRSADLLIVIGTSLTVYPFASLADRVDESCPRVLINIDRVGNFGSKPDDVILLGKCDDIVRDLCKELGWEKELQKAWEKTKYTVELLEDEAEEEPDERLKDELEKLTDQLGKQLAIDREDQIVAKQAAEEAVAARLSKLAESNQDEDELVASAPSVVDKVDTKSEAPEKPVEAASAQEGTVSGKLKPSDTQKEPADSPTAPASNPEGEGKS